MKTRNTLFLIFALLAMLSIGAWLDYQDALEAENIYTAMVCSGKWPDYENRKPDCRKHIVRF